MLTPREVLEAYAGGNHASGTDLRAASAWMLAAWDAVMAAAADTCIPDGPKREAAFEGLMHELIHWDAELCDTEVDVSCVAGLPALLSRRTSVSPKPSGPSSRA